MAEDLEKLLGRVEHRPWPPPNRPWLCGRFGTIFCSCTARWTAPHLPPLVPPRLDIDTFDGSAWIGLVAFWISGIRLRAGLGFPLLSSFPEINVRTYVRLKDKPGIMFLSLDAANYELAMAEISTNTMTRPLRIDLPDRAPLLHFCRRITALLWSPESAEHLMVELGTARPIGRD